MNRKVMTLLFLLLSNSCFKEEKPFQEAKIFSEANIEEGKKLTIAYGCMNCHKIPRLVGNPESIGPSLKNFKSRKFIAGKIENNPKNLIKWLKSPHDVEEKTTMPTFDISTKHARDIAKFLYSL